MKNRHSGKQHTLTIKGFKLSIDYKLLWELIQTGHRIPAWLVYTDEYEEPIWDIVEVKKAYSSEWYDIGVRGTSYQGMKNTIKDFVDNCAFYNLHFIAPEIYTQKNVNK